MPQTLEQELPGVAGRHPAAPILDACDLARDPALVEVLLGGFGATQAGLCLCDPEDRIRFLNAAFRDAFCPTLDAGSPTDFTQALAQSIQAGQGIQLVSMSLEAFVPRVRERRRTAAADYNFSLDTVDGRWWWISDYRLPAGWTLVIANDMSALKREEARLRDAHASALQEAQTDFLTGIANRRWGFEQAAAALRTARSSGAPLAVALMDIDHFKRINDHHGHDVGDRALVHVARWLDAGVRRQDQVSRFGGEEFLLVLPGLRLTEAEEVVSRLLSTLPPVAVDDGVAPVAVTASVGLAAAQAYETLDDLLVRADRALYQAKLAGRDRVVLSRP